MVFGPCGGVTADGGCETGTEPCPFATRPTVRWPTRRDGASSGGPKPPAPALVGAAAELVALMARRPVVVADVPLTTPSADDLRALVDVLVADCDAGLLGDAPWCRVQLPPSLRAALCSAGGLRAWVGLNCRDRNRVALEGELAGLVAAGAAAAHCVTGDHPATGDRPDAAPVFDLDATRLAALAGPGGLHVSVAESPLAPPRAERGARLAEKVRAGAHGCIVNLVGPAEELAGFIDRATAAGAGPDRGVTFLACVPVVTTVSARRLLGRFPGLVLPEAVQRAAAEEDPRRAGIAAAVEVAESYLAVPGVVGVDLTAAAAAGDERGVATDLAVIARTLGGGR